MLWIFHITKQIHNLIYRSEVRGVQRHRRQSAQPWALPAKHTVEVGQQLAFSTRNSCVSETDQWLHPQLAHLLVCHTVTIKSMATQKAVWGTGLGTGVCLLQRVVWGWGDDKHDLLSGLLVDQSVCLSSLGWPRKARQRQRHGEGCWLSGPPTEPFLPQGGPNRHLTNARTFQHFPHWRLFLKETVHFQLICFSQQP